MGTNLDEIRIVRIEEVVQETPTVRTLIFKDPQSSVAAPGQFLMVWIPGVEELPMSVMVAEEQNYAAVTIRKHGLGSSAMFNKRVGEVLGIRGPYGNEFKIKLSEASDKISKKRNQKSKVKSRKAGSESRVLLVGGGTGLVPLLRLATSLNSARIDTTVIIGAKTREEVFFEKLATGLLRDTKHRVLVTTEDGSYGTKGFPTDLMKELVISNFACIYTCGPELMMKKVFDIASEANLHVQCSLERYMKCGIGICCSCCIADRLVCKDGTVFDEHQLSLMPEFGTGYRDKSGRNTMY